MYLKTAIFLLAAPGANAQPAQKQYRDTGEFTIYSQAVKNLGSNAFDKTLADIAEWTRKYPESDYNTERQMLLVHAYTGANQPGPAIDAAAPLLDGTALAADPAGRIRILYQVTAAVQRLPDPTPEQAATGSRGATLLAEMDQAPPGMPAADWEKARGELRSAAEAAQLYLALLPAAKAMKTPPDCARAEVAAKAAVEKHPASVQASWFLGSALVCLGRSDPARLPAALYSLARAAALDPVRGKVDPAWRESTVTPYLDKVYTQYHGADQAGLAKLRQLAAENPFPPAGFAVKTAAQIERERIAEIEAKYPDYALWSRVKAALTAADGEKYFASELKDTAMPSLAGVLVVALPECRPTLLMVTIPVPEGVGVKPGNAEVAIRLAKPLAGSVEAGSEFRWSGVAREFASQPFLLTVESETPGLGGLKAKPCGAKKRE